MASHAQKTDIHLQGGIPQESEKLNFRIYRGGHKINDSHLEGTDILMFRPILGHDEDILFPQGIIGW
jgi:hypothetical protein